MKRACQYLSIGVPMVADDLLSCEYTAKEEGYAFVYVSNENPTLVDAYFDDVIFTYTPSNILQYNEYYPFGLNTANSWTRENVTDNSYLYNAGSERNEITGNYEMFFRNYDPALGRMNGVDVMASKYAGLTPYNYSFNAPVIYNDPLGDDPSDPSRGPGWWRYGMNSEGQKVYHDAHAGMYGASWDRDTYGTGFARYGPGDGGALNAIVSPIAARLRAKQNQGEIVWALQQLYGEENVEVTGNGATVYFTVNNSYVGDRGSIAGITSIDPVEVNLTQVAEAVQQTGNGPGDGWWDSFVNWLNSPVGGGKPGDTMIPGYTVEQYKKDVVNDPTVAKMELASMLVPIPGAAFGKLGKVVTNPGLRITSMSTHAINQAITRGVTSPTILSIVRNPLVVLQQGSGNYLYLSRSGAVVLSPEGKMVTTYSARFFDDTIKGIVGWFK